MTKLTVHDVRRRFTYVASVMNWDTRASVPKSSVPPYHVTGMRFNVGAYGLEKPARSRWRVIRYTSEGGGESNITGVMTNSEAMAWFDGVLFVAERVSADAIRTIP